MAIGQYGVHKRGDNCWRDRRMPKSVAMVSSLCRLERTTISLHDTRPDAEACQDSNSMSLGAACQLVSGEVFAIRSSYGELVLPRSFACK